MKVTSEQAKRIAKKIGIDWSKVDFPLEEFRRGVEVEFEHGSALGAGTDVGADDPAVSGRIAWAHLKELPDYYTRLDKMEEKGEKAKKKEAAYCEGYRVGARTALLDAGMLTKKAAFGVPAGILPGLAGAGIGALADEDALEGALLGGLTGAGAGLGGRVLGGIPVRSGLKQFREMGTTAKIEKLLDRLGKMTKKDPSILEDASHLPKELREVLDASKRMSYGAVLGYPIGMFGGGYIGHEGAKRILGREDEDEG